MPTFEEQVGAIVDKKKRQLLAIARDAVSNVIEIAQTPVAKGGKIRVDTGFLRSSGVAALDQIPSGPSEGRRRGANEGSHGDVLTDYHMEGNVMNGESLNIVLAKWKLGQTLFFGWTAKYAKVRETYDGFLESALQGWQGIVDVSIKKFGQ